MRVTGILCIVTLMLPTLYYLKYIAVDYPGEQAVAKQLAANPPSGPQKPAIVRVLWYVAEARKAPTPDRRAAAVTALGAVIAQPWAQVLHPMECLNAKMALADAAAKDPDAAVKQLASRTLDGVAQRGVVLRR